LESKSKPETEKMLKNWDSVMVHISLRRLKVLFPGRDLVLINVLLSQCQGSGKIGNECRTKLVG